MFGLATVLVVCYAITAGLIVYAITLYFYPSVSSGLDKPCLVRIPRFFGIHAEPTTPTYVLLAVLPFVIVVGAYMYFSHERHLENPSDKFLPSISQMAGQMYSLATDGVAADEDDKGNEVEAKSGYLGEMVKFTESTFVRDTTASLRRLALGTFLGAGFGLLIGLNMGLFRGMEAITAPFIMFFAIVNPLAILPVLFIVFGVDEAVKIVLIFIGTFFPIVLPVYRAAKQIADEQKTKALTLGANQLDVVYRIALPQIIPPFIEALIGALGAAWIFLIAAEAIASTEGLGYRIFLVRRYTAMDIIIPYVAWMTILGFSITMFLQRFIEWRFRWYVASKK